MVIGNLSWKVKEPVAKVKSPARRVLVAKVKRPAFGGGLLAKVKGPSSLVLRPSSVSQEDSGL
jgi:hypothetical protein